MTMVKKNYATLQELQEGNIVDKDHMLDIKGLAINKSSMDMKTRKQLKKILYESILDIDKIDQLDIIKKLAVLENEIYASLVSGSKEYYKPMVIKSMGTYADPMRIQGIKGAVVWNEIRDSWMEAIDLEERNSIDIVKVNINPTSALKIRSKYPEAYERITRLIGTEDSLPEKRFADIFKGSISSVAIPKDVKTPEWLLEFINYKQIVNDKLCNFPLESIGVERLGKGAVNYTNIVKL